VYLIKDLTFLSTKITSLFTHKKILKKNYHIKIYLYY